jgi:hypothetical protein
MAEKSEGPARTAGSSGPPNRAPPAAGQTICGCRQDSGSVRPDGPGSADIMPLAKAKNLPHTPAAGVSDPPKMCRTTRALPPDPRGFALWASSTRTMLRIALERAQVGCSLPEPCHWRKAENARRPVAKRQAGGFRISPSFLFPSRSSRRGGRGRPTHREVSVNGFAKPRRAPGMLVFCTGASPTALGRSELSGTAVGNPQIHLQSERASPRLECHRGRLGTPRVRCGFDANNGCRRRDWEGSAGAGVIRF